MTFQPISGVHPLHVDAGHGPYGWLTPMIAAIAAHDPAFSARVLYLPRRELHFIALCAALMGEGVRDVDRLSTFARSYGTMERKTLVAAFDTVGVDSSIARLAPKLAGAVWREPTYRRLAGLFIQPSGRKLLRHLPAVTRRHVLMLGRLPPTFRTQGILKLIRKRGDLTELLFVIEIVRQIRSDLDDRQIAASLEKAAPSRLHKWMMRHYERVPFPLAPTSTLVRNGVDVLRPLACYDDLARAAREFDNCIRTYLWAVLRGDSYFYRYAPQAGGKGIAIVELRKVPVIGWVVHEALGPGNDPISGTERAAMLHDFREAEIGAAPQAVDPNGPWFDLGC